MNKLQVKFEMRKIRVSLDKLVPLRPVKDAQTRVERFETIKASIKEVGLIEPLMIYPQKGNLGTYLLLDGHLRLLALKELGKTDADCLVAFDNECFIYNARISRVSPIQEHRMIKRAIQNGVQPERIAAALNKPMNVVSKCMKLLDGISDEAAELLKDKVMAHKSLCLLKRVTAVRQIEIAEYLVNSNNFSAGLVETMVLGTPKDQLVNSAKQKRKTGLSLEEIARLQQEMETVGRDFKAVERTYAENMLSLTMIRGYAKKLLDNPKVTRFLRANYRDFLTGFERIIDAETL